MEDLLLETLKEYGYPVIRQGSLSENESYPDHFFTFWNNDTDGEFYNNNETFVIWDYDLNFYSIDPEKVYSVLKDVKKRLRSAGFITGGSGYDVPSDEITHTGRGLNVLYRETLEP